jgi:glycosyltransferase domain-containing protein
MGNRTLSLIIPTLDRPHFLKRALEYLEKQKCSHPVLVADSSGEPARTINQSTIESVSATLQVEHRRYEHGASPEHKIADTLSAVDSRYSVLCADDDFVIPRTIDRCVEFLESHPDYETAAGLVSNLYSVEPSAGNRLLAGIAPGISQSKLWTSPTTPRPSLTIENEHPCARVCAHLLNYHPTFYSVHRRENHLSNIQAAAEFAGDYLFGELMASVLSVIQGKKKHINEPYIIRPLRPDNSTIMQARKQTYDITEDDFSQRYARFRNKLVQILVAIRAASPENARDAINDAFSGFAGQNLIRRELLRANQPKKNSLAQAARQLDRIEKILQALPRSVFQRHLLLDMIRAPIQYARLLYCEEKWISDDNYLPMQRLLSRSSPYQRDFQLIYDHVTSYISECPLLSVPVNVS